MAEASVYPIDRTPLRLEMCGWVGEAILEASPDLRAWCDCVDGAYILDCYTDVEADEVVAEYELLRGFTPNWIAVGRIELRRPRKPGEPVYERRVPA